MRTPDALVLGGGGTLGEAWMSALLAGLEQSEQFDARACGHYVGTSAGSIVAASLVAGLAPDARLGTTAAGAAAGDYLDEAPASADTPIASLRQAFGGVAISPERRRLLPRSR